MAGFERRLSPDDWHHFACEWSPGEIALWLDGRLLASYDMTGRFGYALSSNPVRFVSMADCILDELRISNTPRYRDSFEPSWRGGKRPAYAFTGVPGVARHPMKLEEVYVPSVVAADPEQHQESAFAGLAFDRKSGYVRAFTVGGRMARRSTNGLLLWSFERGADGSGLRRKWLAAEAAGQWRIEDRRIQFEQDFQEQVRLVHEISGEPGAVTWTATLKNTGTEERWLELLMSLPLPMQSVQTYFDGTSQKSQLTVPRRKETWASTLPFVAASGDGMALGVGIDPHTCLPAIPCEWIPEGASGTIRQGAKVALSPNEELSYTFHIVAAERADFGAMNAVEAFHKLFPDLYKRRPDVPIYSYMPTAQYMAAVPFADQNRLCYVGGFWGHGPGNNKGDEYGSEEFWDNKQFDKYPSYAYTRKLEKSWATLDQLHQMHMAYSRRSFDNWYAVRRSHVCPDLTPTYLVDYFMAGYRPNDDPLCFGQYYAAPSRSIWAPMSSARSAARTATR